MRQQREKIAFVLSGGGARGAAQVGMLAALHERGIAPALVLGTSAGAVNGAWYALYPHRLDELERVWRTLRTKMVFPGTPLHAAYNMLRYGYAHRVDGWARMLVEHFTDTRLEDAAIPLGVVAVRLADGEVTVFESGPIVPALLASTAVPGLFPPQRINGVLYVDGGVVEFLPIPSALKRAVTTIYALDCSDYPPGDGSKGLVVDRCSQIAATAWVRTVVAAAQAAGCQVHLLHPPLGDLDDARDFRHTARLIETGYEYARAALAEVARKNQLLANDGSGSALTEHDPAP
jgi:NTE family protein